MVVLTMGTPGRLPGHLLVAGRCLKPYILAEISAAVLLVLRTMMPFSFKSPAGFSIGSREASSTTTTSGLTILQRSLMGLSSTREKASTGAPQHYNRNWENPGRTHQTFSSTSAQHIARSIPGSGIPEFRLPKEIVKKEINYLEKLGVKVEKNFVVGKTATVDELLREEGYDAVFVGSGAGLPSFMGIKGENGIGVYSANEYLTRSNLMRAYLDEAQTPIMRGKRVVTVGGGNVAMDSARTALRLGAEKSIIVYRRSEAEMPARKAEIHHAKEEGLEFNLLCNPVEVLADDKGLVTGIRCIRMELGAPDESGRRRPVPVKGSEFVIECEVVVVAIGNSPNPLIQNSTPDIQVSKMGEHRRG